MNIPQIKMDKEVAKVHYLEYFRMKSESGGKINPTEEEIMQTYKALANGYPIINIRDAFRATGLDDKGRPKLAICRASYDRVLFNRWCCRFSFGNAWVSDNWTRRYLQLGRNFWPHETLTGDDLSAIVPVIPPRHRPKGNLEKYWILWEADWEVAPTDPILLRRINTWTFSVLATWDLTEVERMVLNGKNS